MDHNTQPRCDSFQIDQRDLQPLALLLDDMANGKISNDALARFITKPDVVKRPLIQGFYQVTIPEGMSLVNLVERAQCDSVHDLLEASDRMKWEMSGESSGHLLEDVSAQLGPAKETTSSVIALLWLPYRLKLWRSVECARRYDRTDIEHIFGTVSMQPASLLSLVALAGQHPSLQQDGPIASLETHKPNFILRHEERRSWDRDVWHPGWNMYLDAKKGQRSIKMHHSMDEWPRNTRFVASLKVSPQERS